MTRYKSGRNHRRDKHTISPDEVFDAICDLAEAHATLPTQVMIADLLECSQQHISLMMKVLEREGRVVWLTQRVYFVDRSRWEGPGDLPPS